MGSDRSPGRLPCSLQGLSSFPFSHSGIVSDVPGRLSSGSSLAARDRGDACQRSLRNRPRSGSQLLQSPLPGGEGVWRLETRDRPLSPERLRPADVVQDGNSRFCTVREGDFLASLDLKDAYFQIPIHRSSRKLLRFTSEGTVYQFRALVFRTVDRSPGLHQGLCGHVSVGTLSRDQTSPLSGRLVGSLLLGAGSQTGHPVAALALSHPRDCDKLEVRSRALANCEISRHDHRYRGRQGFSVSGESREIPDGSGELLYHGRSPSSALAGDPRSPSFARAAGSSRSSSDALLAVASEGALVPRVRPSLSSSALATGSETGPVLVVRNHMLTWARFGTPAPDLHLYSDASCSGWGAHLLDQHVSGVWSDQEKLLHINLLEMKALFLGLQAFRDVIGHHVTAMCDNLTVMVYVSKQGGTVSGLCVC